MVVAILKIDNLLNRHFSAHLCLLHDVVICYTMYKWFYSVVLPFCDMYVKWKCDHVLTSQKLIRNGEKIDPNTPRAIQKLCWQFDGWDHWTRFGSCVYSLHVILFDSKFQSFRYHSILCSRFEGNNLTGCMLTAHRINKMILITKLSIIVGDYCLDYLTRIHINCESQLKLFI